MVPHGIVRFFAVALTLMMMMVSNSTAQFDTKDDQMMIRRGVDSSSNNDHYPFDFTTANHHGRQQQEQQEHRQLLLFQDLRCRKKMRQCQAVVGDGGGRVLPYSQWSKTLNHFEVASQQQQQQQQGHVRQEEPPLPNDIFGLIRTLIEIAAQIDFLNIVEQLANAVGVGEQVSNIIEMMSVLFSYLGTIRDAIANGDINTVLNTVVEMISMITGMLRLDAFQRVADMIRVVVDIMNRLVVSLQSGAAMDGTIFDNMMIVVRTVVEYLSDLINVVNGVFLSQFRGDTVCEENLLACSKDKFLMTAVPEMISMGFLAMSNDDEEPY